MPEYKEKDIVFYRGKQAFKFDFSASAISSDGAILLSEKVEKKTGLLKEFASLIPDYRNPFYIGYTYEEMLRQRVFLMMQGYEDCNDEEKLRQDPVITQVLNSGLCSQPTLSRFENKADKHLIFRMCQWFIDRYVEGLDEQTDQIIIDADGTDDPTHGNQQLSLYNGYYEQTMYHELFFKDGNTGQVILQGIIEFLSYLLEGIPIIVDGQTYKDLLRNWVSQYLEWELLVLFLISIFHNGTKLKQSISINGADLEVEFKFCDLLEQQGAIVIPVMDTFDTTLANNLVDRNTLHGKLIIRYYEDKIHVLDSEITASLTRTGDIPIDTDQNLKGKKEKYAIGTTAIVEPGGEYIYLTVLTSMNDTGNVSIQPEYLIDFLSDLWQYIPTYGKSIDVINMPLIGKGINRLPAEYTHQRVAQEIANSFVTNCKQRTFCKKLRICIYPKDAKFINPKKLLHYINHLIEYDFN
jgi:hypothetical protein